jgi:hypothetical protein
MEVRVKIPDAVAELAKARGVPVEEYVEEILSRQVGNGGTGANGPRSAEEVRAWLDSLAQFTDKIPPLPETITRDWIYQEHE